MVDLWEVLGDANRRHLLQLLEAGERSVNQLASHFPVTRSATSQQLLLLVDAGIVSVRKKGRNRYYSLAPEGIKKIENLFENFWGNELRLLASTDRNVSVSG